MTKEWWIDPETDIAVTRCTELWGYYHVGGHVGRFGPDAPAMTPHRWWRVGKRRRALTNYLMSHPGGSA